MITDIKPANPENELEKFADDLTVEVPVYDYGDTSMIEIKNIEIWSKRSRMDRNMEKTCEMAIRRNTGTLASNNTTY